MNAVGKKTSNRKNCKRYLALNEHDRRRLNRSVRSQQNQTLAQITTQVNQVASRTVSNQTMQRSFRRMGFGRCKPTRVPSLNARHQARLIWTREHREWTLENYKRMSWSEEYRLKPIHYFTPMWGWEYGAMVMKLWILHARLQLYKVMAAQSWSGIFSLGSFWDIWYLYQPPSMWFGM